MSLYLRQARINSDNSIFLDHKSSVSESFFDIASVKNTIAYRFSAFLRCLLDGFLDSDGHGFKP